VCIQLLEKFVPSDLPKRGASQNCQTPRKIALVKEKRRHLHGGAASVLCYVRGTLVPHPCSSEGKKQNVKQQPKEHIENDKHNGTSFQQLGEYRHKNNML
jgi:hypothetical protein